MHVEHWCRANGGVVMYANAASHRIISYNLDVVIIRSSVAVIYDYYVDSIVFHLSQNPFFLSLSIFRKIDVMPMTCNLVVTWIDERITWICSNCQNAW